MEAGLAAIFMENRASLLRFLRARGAGDAAEDLLQELWLKLSGGTAGPVLDPLAYLYGAANNLMLDRRRAELRRERREEAWAGVDARLGMDASELESAERSSIARDELRRAEAVLAGLGERTETIFRRFRLEGASQRQIAEELGISLSAVEKHLQRAYRALLQLRRELDAG